MAAGGGEVVVPAGNYIIGSVTMGSNTTLRLEKDVFVIESPDADDYPLFMGRFEGEVTSCHRGMIFAENANHIAIVGPGGFEPNSVLGNRRNPRAPVIIETLNCNDVVFDGFNLQYDTPPCGGKAIRSGASIPGFCTNVVRQKSLYPQPNNQRGRHRH